MNVRRCPHCHFPLREDRRVVFPEGGVSVIAVCDRCARVCLGELEAEDSPHAGPLTT